MKKRSASPGLKRPDHSPQPLGHGFFEHPLAWGLSKHLREDALLQADWRIWTPPSLHGAPITIGLSVHFQGGVTAFEFDSGVREHLRDAVRDAALLGSGKVREVCRIRRGLADYPDDIMFLISTMHRHLFHERGLENLRHLASRYSRATGCGPETMEVRVRYPSPEADPDILEDHDRSAWAGDEATFDSAEEPLSNYLGESQLGVHIVRRATGYSPFSDRIA